MTTVSHKKSEAVEEIKVSEVKAVEVTGKPAKVANPEKLRILEEAGNQESNIPLGSDYWELPEFVDAG